jgi:Fic family protein
MTSQNYSLFIAIRPQYNISEHSLLEASVEVKKPGRKVQHLSDEEVEILKAHYEGGLALSAIYREHLNHMSYQTLHRRLTELIDQGMVDKELHRKNFAANSSVAAQVAANGARTQLNVPSINELLTSAQTSRSYSRISYLRTPLDQRRPVDYDPARIGAYKPNVTQWLPAPIRRKISSLENKARTVQPPELIRRVKLRMLVDIAHNSSRMEGSGQGMGATIAVFKNLLQKSNERPANVPMDDYVVIRNHIIASEYMLSLMAKERHLSLKTLRNIQGVMLINCVPDQKLKSFRKGQDGYVRITDSTYTPVSQQFLEAIGNPVPLNVYIEDELKKIVDKAAMIHDPYEASFFVLLSVAYLQPFYDGNKRTARLACNFPLLSEGCAPLTFMGVRTEDYLDAMIEFYETGNTEGMAEIFYTSYINSVSQYRDLIKASNSSNADTLVSKHFDFAKLVTSRVVLGQTTVSDVLDSCVEDCLSNLMDMSESDCYLLANKIQEDLQNLHSSRAIVYELDEDDVEAFNSMLIAEGNYFLMDNMGAELHERIEQYRQAAPSM